MAEVIRYVDPDATGSGNGTSWTNAYTSLDAWNTAEGTNLVTDGDWHHCYVRASSGTADTTALSLTGWTTGASNYIVIEAEDGDEALASEWDTARYRLSLSNSTALSIEEDYVRIVGIQVEVTSANGTGQDCINVSAPGGATSDIRIQNCRLEGPGSGFAFVQRGIYGTAGTIDVTNTVIHDTAISASGAAGIWCNGATMTVSNVVICDTSYGMYEPSGTITAKNCAVFNCASDDWLSGPTTIDYCASDDGDGTNSVSPSGSDWDNEFTDPATGDFTLLSTGNLFEAGTPISGLTTDIDGDTYDTTNPSIGVDEPTSGATAYSITAESGTFTETGTAADLLKGYAIDAGAGSFTETGTAAGLFQGFAIDADSGTFTATGQDATLQYGANVSISAEAGAYTLTGADAGLYKGYAIDAGAGEIVFTGSDATLTYAVANSIEAESGSFTATGTDADLLKTWKLTAGGGAFIETGTDAALNYGLAINAETGVFTETGTAATLAHDWLISAEAGSIAYTGSDVTLNHRAQFIPIDRRSIIAAVSQRRAITAAVTQRQAVTSQVTQRYDMEATIGG